MMKSESQLRFVEIVVYVQWPPSAWRFELLKFWIGFEIIPKNSLDVIEILVAAIGSDAFVPSCPVKCL